MTSSSHVVSAAPSSSGGELLTLCPSCSVGSLPWEIVPHELLQCESFPQAAVLQELLQRGSLPLAAVLQEQTAPAWVPHEVTSPARKPAPVWDPLSTGPARSLLQHELLTESQPPLGASTFSSMGSSTGCRWRSTPLRTFMGFKVTAYLTTVFSRACRGICAPASGTPLPPPSSLTLVSAELFLTYSHSSLQLQMLLRKFFSLLNCVIPVDLPPLLMGSALASSGSLLEPAGIGSIRHRGSFWQFLTEATPVTPPATKTLPHKPNTLSHLREVFFTLVPLLCRDIFHLPYREGEEGGRGRSNLSQAEIKAMWFPRRCFTESFENWWWQHNPVRTTI